MSSSDIISPESPGTTDETRRDLRVAGTVASLASLVVLWVGTALIDGVSFAPIALAEALIRATPGDLATFLIETLGPWAARFLSIGALAGAVLLGRETFARTARTDRARPILAACIVASASLLAQLLGPSGDEELLPSLVLLVLSGVIYGWTGHLAYRSRRRQVDQPDLGRRRVFRIGFGAVAGLAVAGGVAGWFIRRMAGPSTDVALVAPESPAAAPLRSPFPKIPGLSPEITSTADHYVVDINILDPSVEAEGWTLRIGGLVDTPLEFDFGSLQERFDIVEEFSVLTCISNEVEGSLVGNSAWGGPRLNDILAEAGVKEGAVDIVLTGADGYTDSIPLEVGRHPSTLLAVSQNGRPLTQEHGFPCRLRVPTIYGMKNVKWLTSIEIVDNDYQGYWMVRGWSDEAVVKTQSRIDVAGVDGGASRGQPTWVAGIAWAGTRGISKVEVSVDGGQTWSEAKMKEALAPHAWRLWAYRWTPTTPGRRRVICRAYDGEGTRQIAARAAPHPSGSTGLPMVDVNVS